jgi:hypothetical protein
MNKFKLLWENNPDTPINAESLSNSVDSTFEYKDVVYKDTAPLLKEGNYSDNYVKLRANTKVLLKSYTTSAMFFNKWKSLTSHNSKYGPLTQENTVFVDYVNGKSMVYAGVGTENIITNSGFENDFASWSHTYGPLPGDVDYDPTYGEEYQAKIELDSDSYHGSKSVQMFAGSYGRFELDRSFDLTGITTFSLSFFYKANIDGLRFSLSSGGRFWKNNDWNPSASDVYNLPSTNGEWKRFELKNIPTQKIINTIADVQILVFSTTPGLRVNVDSFQLESNRFCSPYTPTTRADSSLSYPFEFISLDRGHIDVVFYPKELSDFTLFSLTTSEPYDALELRYVQNLDQFEFRLYDTAEQDFTSLVATADLSQNIDTPIRIACSWDKDIGLRLKTSSSAIYNSGEPFTPVERRYFNQFDIASTRGTNVANVFFESLKINKEMKEEVDINADFLSSSVTEDDVSRVLLVGPEAAVLGPEMLDSGSFQPESNYFIYAVDDMDDEGGSIVISLSNEKPQISTDYHTFTKVGGFKTGVDSLPMQSSVWDAKTKQDKIHTMRFLVNGTDSDAYGVDIRTQPIAEENDVRSQYPIHFSNNMYGRHFNDSVIFPTHGAHNVQYFEVNKDGWVGVDNIHIDGNKIQTRNYPDYLGVYNNDLDLTVHNAGENPRVWIHAPFVDIDSGADPGQDIHLDDILIDNNKMYTKVATDLLIDVTERDSNNDIIITAFNMTINADNDLSFNVNSDFNIQTTAGAITLDDIMVNGDNIYSGTETVNIDSAGTGQIELDDIHIKDYTIHRDAGDIVIKTPDEINIEADDIEIGIPGVGAEPDTTRVAIRSDEFIVDSKIVQFNNVDASDFITFDQIKIQGSTISSPNQSLNITSDFDIYLSTPNNIELSETGGIFVSRVNSYFKKDTYIDERLIFSKPTNPNAAWMYAASNNAEAHVVLEHASGNASIIVGNDGITINGNLNVTGTQSTVNSTETEIADSTFTISVSDPIANTDAAFEVQRSGNNAKLFWDESELYWKVDMGDGILHDIIFNGYDERFQENINIVTSQPAGFKLENDLAVAGMELLNPDDYTMAAGEAIMNIGLHMDQTGGYIGNKQGSETVSVGGWMTIDTRSGDESIHWKWEPSGSNTEIVVGGFYLSNRSLYQQSSGYASDPYFSSTYIKTNVIEAIDSVSDVDVVAGDQKVVTFQADGNATFAGEVFAAKVHNAVWGDIAETWKRLSYAKVKYHQVVVRDFDGVKPSKERAQKGVVGVVSDSYGYLLKSDGFDAKKDLSEQDLVPIALKGTVKVMLHGDARLNDEVVSYKDGMVVKANWFEKVFKRDRIVGVIDGWDENNVCILRV